MWPRQAVGQEGLGDVADVIRIQQEDFGARGFGDLRPINARDAWRLGSRPVMSVSCEANSRWVRGTPA